MDTEQIRRILQQNLESLQAAGVGQLERHPLPTPPPQPDPAPELAPIVSAPVSEQNETDQSSDVEQGQMGKKKSAKSKKDALRVLHEQVVGCELCQELAATRTQTVFGVGDPAARLCFFGEAPGADEDRQGEPFVGRAGKLLNDIISKGMGLQRSDVYILNVLKCRPPGNRNPSTEESQNCRPFFEKQLEIIAPEFICCLGSVAAQTLLETNQTIGRLRGKLHQYRSSVVVATYHPAYLLRNPSAKKSTWEDIQLLMREMQIEPPPSKP